MDLASPLCFPGLIIRAENILFDECRMELGDTHAPFAKLGKQLRLPQTATLSLRAPER